MFNAGLVRPVCVEGSSAAQERRSPSIVSMGVQDLRQGGLVQYPPVAVAFRLTVLHRNLKVSVFDGSKKS